MTRPRPGYIGRPRRSAAGLLLTVSVFSGACVSDPAVVEPTSSPSRTEDGSPTPGDTGGRLADARVRLQRVAVLDQPVALAVRTGDEALYVAEKIGRVVALVDDAEPTVVLDLRAEVSQGSEQGLLGLSFSPDGRFLYLNLTDGNGDTRIVEYVVEDDRIDPSSRREVLSVAQPFTNHNGGNLAFGPDGYLYIGLGDGGSAGDPMGNGQSLSTLLGAMLRISPRPAEGRPYGIPPDNPFVDREGVRPEIWAFGLRNPWRYSFDRETGDLWIGDVGQNAWEEIDLEEASSPGGSNFGWNLLEGTHQFQGDASSSETVPPVFEYPKGVLGCAVTGGYVYRGEAIPELVGAYVFGDFCGGRLEAFAMRGGRAAQHRELGPVVDSLASFGEDASGELYALSLSGPVYRLVPDDS